MVLRAGIIIPFQFGDIKKLLMVGSPGEDRDLKLFDFTNVVRAAFNVYNFEFRNKKIDFTIPEELLIHYLEQCKDLTNFVIQVDQGSVGGTTPIASTDYENSDGLLMRSSFSTSSTALPRRSGGDLSSPLDVTSHSDHSVSYNPEPIEKFYIDTRTSKSLTQSIDPIEIMPKSEEEDTVIMMHGNKVRILRRYPQHQNQQQQQLPPLEEHIHIQTPPFFSNYGHTHPSTLGPPPTHIQPPTHHPPHLQHATNRFRRRGERMSKDQKEIYVKFFEENPCMLQQRRNDAALAPLWNKLASMLNSVQQGAVKNVEEWKQTFDAWRYRVFMYSRYNSKLVGEAAQNPKNYKPLTHTDQRAYAMWTSNRSSSTSEYDKMDMFSGLEETEADDYDY